MSDLSITLITYTITKQLSVISWLSLAYKLHQSLVSGGRTMDKRLKYNSQELAFHPKGVRG